MQEDVGSYPSIYNRILFSHDSGCARGRLDEAKCVPRVIPSVRGDLSGHLVFDLVHPFRPQNGVLLLPIHWHVRALLLCQRQHHGGHQEHENAHCSFLRWRGKVS